MGHLLRLKSPERGIVLGSSQDCITKSAGEPACRGEVCCENKWRYPTMIST
jgi:hypothetical protein